MFANRWWLVLVVVASLLICGGTAWAQMSLYNPAPSSSVGGYTGNAMTNIYRQSIGSNYSASSMIRNDISGSRAIVPYVGQSVQTSAGYDVGVPTQTRSKPFANVSSSPTVSPWMNMFRNDLSGEGDLNYQTLVRPQLDQERFNRQIERQNLQLGQRVEALAAQPAYNPQGSQYMYPTGHPTVFMDYRHFYPVRKRQR
jgi:hypothetical protein